MRKSRQDPGRQVSPQKRVDCELQPELSAALEAYRTAKHMKRAHAVRALLAAQLRAEGFMAALRQPEDAAHLEDVHAFPWPSRGAEAHRRPTTLAWWSRDPHKPTWATLLHAMEFETETQLSEVAKRHGISRIHATRIFRRFDLWRRGQDHRPRLDPFAGRSRQGHNKGAKGVRRKKNAKG